MRTKIILKSGKDESLRRFHPWVFSGAIKKIQGPVSDGDLVDVYDNHDEYLGSGHYGTGSIAVRVISTDPADDVRLIMKRRIQSAYDCREKLGITETAGRDAYRLVFAEGDGLPGLVIDWYKGTAVLQAHSAGMYRSRDEIVAALRDIYGESLKAVYDKSAETLSGAAKGSVTNAYLLGVKQDALINEQDSLFRVNWEDGQKTGFFLDQYDNRRMLQSYAHGRKVLNAFCYTGAFSVAALRGGASLVHSVDSSARAIDLCRENLLLNGYSADEHQCFTTETMKFLEKQETLYDLMVLDPPAFAKHLDARHHAVQGYKRLNAEAIRKVAPGGLIFTFSCSQVVDRRLFNATVMSAAIVAGRRVRIIHQLSQPADHPVNAFHPEGEYLKGLVLFVE